MSKANDFMMSIKTKSMEELIKLGEDRRAELFALKFQSAIGSLEQTHKLPMLKRDIARIEMLITERKLAGEKVTKNIKANYSKAVEEAEKAGKIVRQKYKEELERLEKKAKEKNLPINDLNENQQNVVKALADDDKLSTINEEQNIIKETSNEQKIVKEKVVKKEFSNANNKKVISKDLSKIEVKTKKEKEQKIQKKVTPKIEESEKTKKTVRTTQQNKKVVVESSEAKATGKGKEALKDVKVKSLNIEVVKGEDIEGIDLKLSKKPKNAKTYTFGSNAEVAKKQIAEANKKIAEKKATKTAKTTTKGAK